MGWISVKDRLPENDDEILVTRRYREQNQVITDVMYNPKHSRFEYCDDNYYGIEVKDVIAWMPLPEPYQGDDK